MILRLYKFLILIGTLYLALIVNLESWDIKSSKQYYFEKWLSKVEDRIDNASASKDNIPVTIEGRYKDTLYTFKLSQNDESKETLIRILELLKETNIFSYQKDTQEPEDVELFVKGYGSSFYSSVPSQMATTSNKLQLLFKLLELKGEKSSASAFALHSDKDSIYE